MGLNLFLKFELPIAFNLDSFYLIKESNENIYVISTFTYFFLQKNNLLHLLEDLDEMIVFPKGILTKSKASEESEDFFSNTIFENFPIEEKFTKEDLARIPLFFEKYLQYREYLGVSDSLEKSILDFRPYMHQNLKYIISYILEQEKNHNDHLKIITSSKIIPYIF